MARSINPKVNELAMDAARLHAQASVAWSAEDQALLRALATLAEESAIVATARSLRASRYVVDAPGAELDGYVL